MNKIEPRVLRGFRDYLPEEMIPRQRMLGRIEKVFQSFGFVPLGTPALEYYEILMGKYGEEGSKLLYRFRDEGDRDVALRYDLTVPLARVVAMYPELPRPFRRYQIAPVWRAERPARGRFREFYQCDADIAGSPDVAADTEIVQLGASLLEDLGVERFRIRLNHRKVLLGLMAAAGIPSAAEVGVLRTIDKLPKIGPDETRRLLREENGLQPPQVDRVFEFLAIQGSTAEILASLERFFPDGPGREGTEILKQMAGVLDALGLGARIAIDLSIARGIDYYTGPIYETFLEDLPGFGAVMSGGRYDGLIGTFTRKEEIPAVGISLGIDRLLAGLQELKLIEANRGSVAPVVVTVFSPECLAASLRAAAAVRGAGIHCELYAAFAKLAKQFKFAERRGARAVVVVGPDEEARGEAQVKDMASGAQGSVPLAGLGEHVKKLLESSTTA